MQKTICVLKLIKPNTASEILSSKEKVELLKSITKKVKPLIKIKD